MRNRLCYMLLACIIHLSGISYAQDPLVIQEAKKEIVLTGFTRSRTTVTLSSEVAGKVVGVNYDVGQPIEKKPVYEIDTTFIDFEIQSVRQSLKKLEVAQKKLASQTDYLAKEFERIDILHKGDRATEVKRDAAAEEYEQAKFELDSLKMDIAMAKISLNELLERKRRYNIYAPEGWIVVEKIVEKEEIVAAGTPLAKVANYRTLVVPLAVSAKEYAKIKTLPPEFDAQLENRRITAAIHWVNPEFDEQTRKLNIELVVKEYDGEKRGGLSFALPLVIETEGLWVPKSAVISRYDNPRVTLAKTGETVNILVLGEADGYLIVAEDKRLPIGTELSPQ